MFREMWKEKRFGNQANLDSNIADLSDLGQVV